MSIDPYFALDLVSYVIAALILSFGAYRALLFRRAFNNKVFRDRATWTAAVLLAWIVPNDTQLLFYDLPLPTDLTGAIPLLVTVVLAVVLIIVVSIFIDRNVRAAKELDFFHRDSLGWQRGRLVVLIGAPASLLANLLEGFVVGNQQAATIAFVLLPAILAYGVAALLLAGSRVHNQYFRKYLKLMAAGFAFLLVTFPVSISVLYDAALLLGTYFLYLSATSLYALKDIQKEQT